MNKVKIVLFYVLYLLAIGCASKKSFIEKVSEVKSDTIYSKVETITRPPILSSLTINEVCDSITGKAKDFKQVFIVNGDTLELSIKNNELNIKVNQLKQELSKIKKDYKVSNSNTNTSKESKKVIVRTSFKVWVFLILSVLGNLTQLYFLLRGKTRLF